MPLKTSTALRYATPVGKTVAGSENKTPTSFFSDCRYMP